MSILSQGTVDFLLTLTIALISVIIGLLLTNVRKQLVGKTALLFCFTVLGFLVTHLDKTEDYWIHYVFKWLDFSLPFSFYLLCRALFDDGFRFKPWMLALWFFFPILFFAYIYFFQIGEYNDSYQSTIYILIRCLTTIFLAILAIVEVVKTRDEDLVLERIQFRKQFIILIATTIVITVISEVMFKQGDYPIPLEVLQKGFILLLTYYFCMQLLTLRKGFFWNETPAKQVIEKPKIDQDLVNKLLQKMEIEKIYRTEGLSIRQLAEILEVKEYKLRQTINQQLNFRNFSAFLNSYRIQEASDLLTDSNHKEHTIIEIAYQVGYNSLAPFNKAFKEINGMTPTQWRKHN